VGFRVLRFPLPVLVLLGASSCQKSSWEEIAAASPQSQSTTSNPERSPISIETLFPPSAIVGVPFQVQPDGSSSIGVAGSGFTRTSVVYFDEQPLITNYQSPRAIAGLVSGDLLASSRTIQITVRDSQPEPRKSRVLSFEIHDFPVSILPKIREIFPISVQVGVPFGVLPDGNCSIGVTGSGFLPEARVFFDEEALPTTYQGPNSLSALVPAEMVSSPRAVTVTVRISGERRAGAVPFIVKR